MKFKYLLSEAGVNVRDGIKQETPQPFKMMVGGKFVDIDKPRMLLFISEYGKKNRWPDEKIQALRTSIKNATTSEAYDIFQKEFSDVVKLVKDKE